MNEQEFLIQESIHYISGVNNIEWNSDGDPLYSYEQMDACYKAGAEWERERDHWFERHVFPVEGGDKASSEKVIIKNKENELTIGYYNFQLRIWLSSVTVFKWTYIPK
jgi:hypothetical protein